MKAFRSFLRSDNLVRQMIVNFSCDQRVLSPAEPKCHETNTILKKYQILRHFVMNRFTPRYKIKPEHVFTVKKTNMAEIKVYGFDYDYTLAEYADVMQKFIYRKAVNILVKKYKYPEYLLDAPRKSGFCIRGLHYDIKRGLIMKIDERHIVQLDTVYRGYQKLKKEEAMRELNSTTHVPKNVMDESCFRGSENLQQLTDLFSLPEMLLLTNVVHCFTKLNVSYEPATVFDAVERAVREVHTGGHLYRELSENVDKYLDKDHLVPLVNKLKGDGKRLFILTNSSFPSVDVGMKHMLGENWREYFELVIVDAKKPQFFDKSGKLFKLLLLGSPSSNEVSVSWNPVKELKRYEVYCGGCCSELMRLKGWKAREVMYFGDQIYADLQSPNQSSGWHTCAVIHELKQEIDIMNTEKFARNVVWVQTLEKLIEKMQEYDLESWPYVRDWLDERNDHIHVLKVLFNCCFGSVFDSSLQRSYFLARLSLVADIYTSSVMNLMKYPEDKMFYPPRGSYSHEQLVSSSYQHDGFDELLSTPLTEDNE